ncbi:MAG: universal stress protein [Dehalococcoidia bacterium]
MSRILVPLDLSPLAEEALPWAALLARVRQCGVHLLAVWNERAPLAGVDGNASLGEILAAAKAALDRMAARPTFEGIEVSTEVRAGEIEEEVAEAVVAQDVDLVVMKSHGRGGFKRLLVGSVADRLLRTLNVPMLVDRQGGVPPALHRILVTLDGSPEAETALDIARELAAAAGAEVVLLTVYEEDPQTHIHKYPGSDYLGALPEEVHAAADRYMAAVAREPERREIREGRPAGVIIDVARELECDIIVMATRGRSSAIRLALGSTSDAVMRAADRPVLFVPLRGDSEST